MRNAKDFSQVFLLWDSIGKISVDDGKFLAESLDVSGVSLWEAMSAYEILYRLPLLFEKKHYYTQYFFHSRARLIKAKLHEFIKKPDLVFAEGFTFRNEVKSVLFASFSMNHYASTVGPILEKNGRDECFSTSIVAPSLRFLEEANFLTKNIIDTHEINKKISKIAKKKLIRLKKIVTNSIELKKISDRFGVNLNDLRNEIEWMFTGGFYPLLPIAYFGLEVMERSSPSVFVTSDSVDQRCRILLLAAKKKNIKSLVIQQGLTSPKYPEWRFFLGNAIACYGAQSQKIMLEQELPANKIFITGPPNLDGLLVNKLPEKSSHEVARKKLENYVLFATQPYIHGAFVNKDARLNLIKSIIQIHKELPIKLYIKPHPDENLSELRGLCRNAPNVVLCNPSDNLIELTRGALAFTTMFSTAALQALYQSKPVIALNFPQIFFDTPFTNGVNGIHSATNAIEYRSICNEIFSAREFFQAGISGAEPLESELIYKADGLASKRVTEAILRLMNA